MKPQNVKINGCKLSVNMMDMNFLKKLTTANAAYQAAGAAAGECPPDTEPQMLYEWMDAHVTAICAFFDAVYGDGTAERIFKRTNVVAVYWQAVQDFAHGIEKADKAVWRKYGI